jgi:hypothetical protein
MKLVEIKLDSRQNFKNTWLYEMPSGNGVFETFDTLEASIRDFVKHGIKPEILGDSLNRIVSGDINFYWYSDGEAITLASELHTKPEGLVVSLTGKNEDYKGKPPFASNLYSAILKHTDKSIRILSDKQLSDEGLNLWKKMLSQGHKISVYDNREPGKTFQSFENEDELNLYFKNNDINYERYQYILSENILDYCTVRASFRLRLHREKSNLNLD